MKLRLLAAPAALAVLAMLGTASYAHEGHAEGQVKDASDDSLDKQGSHDIIAVNFEVTKTVTKSTKTVKGKKVTVTTSTPKDFVVTLALHDAPSQLPGAVYNINAGTACGDLTLQTYYDSTAQGMVDYSNFAECGPEEELAGGLTVNTFDLAPEVKFGDHFISFTMPWKSLPKEIKLGATWSDPLAYTALADPFFGFDTVSFVDPATAIDWAEGSAFKLS